MIGPKEGCNFFFFGTPYSFFSPRPTEIIIWLENETQEESFKELGLAPPEEVRESVDLLTWAAVLHFL